MGGLMAAIQSLRFAACGIDEPEYRIGFIVMGFLNCVIQTTKNGLDRERSIQDTGAKPEPSRQQPSRTLNKLP
jgi:hypothetical protein